MCYTGYFPDRAYAVRPFLFINIALGAAFRRIVDRKSIKHLTYLLNLNKITWNMHGPVLAAGAASC
jgi:hypothetical protein